MYGLKALTYSLVSISSMLACSVFSYADDTQVIAEPSPYPSISPSSASIPDAVEFPSDVSSVSLPVKEENGHLYVRVTIAGRGLDFKLDSGFSAIAIDSDIAKDIGLPVSEAGTAQAAQRFSVEKTVIPSISIGPLVMHDVPSLVTPSTGEATPDVRVAGRLGFDFIAQVGLTIDYDAGTVVAVPAELYVPPSAVDALVLDVRLNSRVPMTTVSLDGANGDSFVVDTGGVMTLLVSDHFAELHKEIFDNVEHQGPLPRLFGVGGSIGDVIPYKIGHLIFATIDFRDAPVFRITSPQSYPAIDGLIGPDLLRLFTVGIDYRHSRIYLVPNARGRGLGLS
jgi:hypothetical protein